MSLQEEYQLFLQLEEDRKTRMGKGPSTTIPASPQYPEVKQPSLYDMATAEDSNFWHRAQNIGGQFLWSMLDEASLSTLGLVEETQPDWLGPEWGEMLTAARESLEVPYEEREFAEKTAAGVGTVAGFIVGAPKQILKVAGKGLGWATRKVASKKTLSEMLQKGSKEAAEHIDAGDLSGAIFSKSLQGGISKSVGRLSRHNQISSTANFSTTIARGIDATIDDVVKKGFNPKTAKIIGEAYKKHVKDRPVHTLVDYVVNRSANKKIGYGIGSMIQEGFQFGVLDGVREGFSAWGRGHDYNYLEPIWGTGMGVGFGALKFLPAIGKSSAAKPDFVNSLRAQLAKSDDIFKKYSYGQLKLSAEQIGANARPLGLEVVKNVKYGGKTFDFDLTSVEGETLRILDALGIRATEAAKSDIVRDVLARQANTYGKELLKWAGKSEWAATMEAWPNMIGGAVIMNARSFIEMGMGHGEVDAEDITINLLLGAWLNRRGTPRRTDMFPEQIQRLRGGIHELGILSHKQSTKWIEKNPFITIPSLDPATSSALNPFASNKQLNKFVKFAEQRGLTTDDFDSIDSGMIKGRSVNQSGENLELFHEFYRFLEGASTKSYAKNLDSISENDALAIQKKLAAEYGDIVGLRNTMRAAADNAGARFENEVVSTTVDMMKALTGIKVGSGSDGNIGKIPSIIIVDNAIYEMAKRGELKHKLDNFEDIDNEVEHLKKIERKMTSVLHTTHELGRASKKLTDGSYIINETNIHQLEAVARILNTREVAINNELGLSNVTGNRFQFENVWSMVGFLNNRVVNQKVAKFSKMMDKDLRDHDEVFSLLHDVGLIRTKGDVEIAKDASMLESLDQIKFVNADFTRLKDSNQLLEAKQLVSSVLEVLGAKGQYKTTSEPVNMTLEQVSRLRSFLNRKGINTDATNLSEFASTTVTRIQQRIFRDSKFSPEDISVFQTFFSLGSPSINNKKFNLMKYNNPGKGNAVGIIVNKVKYVGDDARIENIAREYNEFVDGMIKRGEVPGERDNFVKEGETYTITNPNSFLTIQSVLHDARTGASITAQRQIIQSMAGMGQSRSRDAALAFIQAYPKKIAQLTRVLIHKGVLELKAGKGIHEGTFEYYVNKEKWNDPDAKSHILQFIERNGINLDSIDSMLTNARKQLENYLDDTYTQGDNKANITPKKFFDLYLPEKSKDPNFITEWFEDKLYDFNNEFIGPNAINDILTEMKIDPNKRREAGEHLTALLSNKLQSAPKKILYWSDGEVRSKDTDIASNKTPYFNLLDKIGLKYALVDGTSHDWVIHPLYDKLTYEPLDIFQAGADTQTDFDRTMIQERKDLFVRALRQKTDVTGFESGLELIELPGMKLQLAVSRGDIELVKQAFGELYKRNIDQAPEGSVARRSLESYKERLENSISWDLAMPEVIKALVAENMGVGKNKNMFLEFLEMNPNDLNKYFVGRQKLFNTMKFKRVDENIMKIHSESNLSRELTFDEYQSNEHYRKKKQFGIGIFNDKSPTYDLKKIFESQPGMKKGDWAKYYGDRESQSSFDSISFISKRMADFLGLHYGASGSRIFKPVISSQGEGNLLYSKTEFVYDPKLDKFFAANPELDILMSKTADKLDIYKSEANELLEIPKDRWYTTGAIDHKKIIKVPLGAIGVQKIPDHFQLAKLPPSAINNHTDIDLSRRLYNDYYAENIGKNLENITKILENPFMEAQLIKDMKSGMDPTQLEDLSLLDGADFHTSLHLEWLNLSPYASMDVFGPQAKMDPIKAKFIDSAMAPSSGYSHNGIPIRFGAKSTLAQSFGLNLQGTKFNPETGVIERYGEMMLPYEVGGEGIDFKGRDNFKVKVIDKVNNKVLDAEQVYKEVFRPFSDKDTADKAWKSILTNDRPLEALFNAFEMQRFNRYDVAISTMRFPRTRPNDLHLLRLRGFLNRKSGNGAVVNPFDVYHIFEGDYDIDAIDYFWGGSNAWFENIQRQQKVFVPTADVSRVAESLPNIKLLPENPDIGSKSWGKLDGNRRVLSAARGLVQGTSAVVKHMDNIAEVAIETDPTTGKTKTRKVLMRNPNKEKGENGYWEVEMDWNNADFHLRQALEGQILLDATSPNSDLFKTSMEWRWDFLFPRYSDRRSLARENFINADGTYNTSNLRSFINGKKTGIGEYADYRVRLFRKFELRPDSNGKMKREEVDLGEVEMELIKDAMSKYGKLLRVTPGRNVYTQGTSASPKYADLISHAQSYFNYAKNFESASFYKLENMRINNPMNPNKPIRKFKDGSRHAKDFHDLFGPQFHMGKDKEGKTFVKKSSSRFSTKSPWADGVVQNMRDRWEKPDAGGVVERMLREVYMRDPLNALTSDTHILTNKSFVEMENLSSELLNNEYFNTTDINNLMPKFLGQINHDVDLIKRLKTKWVYFNNSRMRGKQAKMTELNKQIEKLEEKLKPLLTKEYYKSRKARDIGKPDKIEIKNDRSVIDGTVQYYVMDHLSRAWWENRNVSGYKDELRELRIYFGKNYSARHDLMGIDKFKDRSMYSEEMKRYLAETKDMKEIELTGEQMLTKGVLRHGLSFLWDFAMPSVATMENKLGIFQGNVMPVATSSNGNYKRAIRWLLKGMAGKLDPAVYVDNPNRKQNFREVLESIAEVDFVWRRYFQGLKGKDYIPLDAAESNKLMTYGAPKWHWKLKNMFSKYTDISIEKDVNEFNPFGMGRKYDMNIEFFRSLSNLNTSMNEVDFDQGVRVLSYTNQLMMQNGYMTPLKQMGLMASVSQKLSPMMEKVFPSQIDIRSGKTLPLRPFDMLNNPLYVLLGGGYMNGPGLTLNP